jgi:hypothetical protein
MLEREWVSLTDPEEPHDRYVFDISFLLSSYTCIYGAGCPGTGAGGPQSPVVACCGLGAHYVDEDDRAKVEAMVDEMPPEMMQFHKSARKKGVTAVIGDGEVRTRIKDGACIFLNREGWPTGPGCSLHHLAVSRGEHHMTYKPEVCWIVPLRREVEESTADDGEILYTTTITSYDRGGWGPGGSEFEFWCTDDPLAYVAAEPVYKGMEFELREMTSDAVYEELAAYLEDRRSTARKPLPFPVFVR